MDKSTATDSLALLTHDLSEANIIFVHSRLDDLRLPVAPFRVYCHLSRRASQSGAAWPSVDSIARVCRLNSKTVRASLRLLVSWNLVVRRDCPGRTNTYTLTRPSQWLVPSAAASPSQFDTPPSNWEGTPPQTGHHRPYQKEPDEGNPIEGNPLKEELYPQSIRNSSLEEIYQLYPRKVAKPDALRAIQKAVAEFGESLVSERTRLFASTCNWEPQFIPHPAAWFNQQRFNDDPSTWRTVNTPRPNPRAASPAKARISALKFNETKI